MALLAPVTFMTSAHDDIAETPPVYDLPTALLCSPMQAMVLPLAATAAGSGAATTYLTFAERSGHPERQLNSFAVPGPFSAARSGLEALCWLAR
jgi:hypothetical protein